VCKVYADVDVGGCLMVCADEGCIWMSETEWIWKLFAIVYVPVVGKKTKVVKGGVMWSEKVKILKCLKIFHLHPPCFKCFYPCFLCTFRTAWENHIHFR
jgi:hypothetical protein